MYLSILAISIIILVTAFLGACLVDRLDPMLKD
jgi:hypothetical protein